MTPQTRQPGKRRPRASSTSSEIGDGLDIPDFLRVHRRDAEKRRRENEEYARTHPVTAQRATYVKRGEYPDHWYLDPGFRLFLVELDAQKEYQKAVRAATSEPRPSKKMTLDEAILQWRPDMRRRDARHALKKVGLTKTRFSRDKMLLKMIQDALTSYAPPVRASRGTRTVRVVTQYPRDGVLRALTSENPRREGSAAHARFELLADHDGKTVGEFLDAGGNPETLMNAVNKKWTEVRDAGSVDRKTGKAATAKKDVVAGRSPRKGERGVAASRPRRRPARKR